MKRRILSAGGFIFLIAMVANAWSFSGRSDSNSPSKEEVNNAKFQLQAQTQYSPSVVQKLEAIYEQVLANQANQEGFQVKLVNLDQLALTAESQIAALKSQLEKQKKLGYQRDLPSSLPSTVADLELLLAKTYEELASIKYSISSIDEFLSAPENNISLIRQRISAIGDQKEKLELDATENDRSEFGAIWQQANEWLAISKAAALNSEELMLQKKQAILSLQSRLFGAKRAVQVDKENAVAAEVELIQGLLQKSRKLEAAQSLNEANILSENAQILSSEIAAYIDQSQVLGIELNTLTESLNRISARSLQATKQLELLNDQFQSAQQRLKIVGLTESLGHLLVEMRNELPAVTSNKVEHDAVVEELSVVALRKFELQGEIKKLQESSSEQEVLLASLGSNATRENTRLISEIIENRIKLLKEVAARNSDYMNVLSDLDYNLLELIEVTKELDDFLLRKLMWVRTASPITSFAMDDVLFELFKVGQYYKNVDLFHSLTKVVKQFWVWFLAVTLVLILVGKKSLKIIQREKLQAITSGHHSTLIPASKYLLVTLVQSLPIGIFAFICSRLIDFSSIPITHSSLVSHLWLYLIGIDFVCRLMLSNGFAHTYLQLPELLVYDMRKGFIRFRNLVVVPLLVIAMIPWNELGSKGYGFLGTITMAFLMCLMAYSNHYFLSVRYSILGSIVHKRMIVPVSNLQKFLRFLMIFGPIVLAVYLLVGYRYAALVLSSRVFETIIAVPYLILAYQFAARGLAEFQSKVKYRQETVDVQAQILGDEASKKNDGSEVQSIEINRSRSLDDLAEDTEKLLSYVFVFLAIICLGYIWSSVLPAFSIFEEVVLWSSTSVVAGEEIKVSVTLKSLISMVLGIYVAYIAARKLPAFVEMVLLSRINLSNGSRYAITTLMSYVLIGLAISFIAKSIGFGWDKLQWALAALSVGIGFGLQEIVANFISGIIILFERPIRVGDLVTINGQTGVVHRIQIRATTLRDFDNKELLVPNKEFITSSLLNWTLTDKEVRILLPVGIGYGSDVEKALELLKAAALEHPEVLDEPVPMVTFEAFGDNALSLYLRCRIASVDDRLRIVTDLHKSINAKYNEAGISIAFPQRDVHVDFAAPLEVVFKKPTSKQI